MAVRFAVIILSVPATLIGGTVLVNSSRHIRHDIAMVVADLKREERDAALMAVDPDHIPALAVAGVDFSYGPVQVLFDVNIHVERGETLALLGTNGAGKSTVLSVIITVGRGEVVGLIGTNGAGKSTLVNAIGGYVPSRGRIELEGTDISDRNAAARAHAGLGRTFQAAGLFPELTVRETVMVALEARGRTGFVSSALALPPSLKRERVRASEAGELIGFLGLGRYADAFIADLSTGTRRIVELAGLLALDARVLCLDEPTAGVAHARPRRSGRSCTRSAESSMPP